MNEETVSLLGSVENAPVLMIPVDAVGPGDSPRLDGTNLEHVEALAQLEDALPPILVHRETMAVIDGVHRLRAVRMRNASEIAARFFDGDSDAAFMLSVRANIEHGLPLPLADRTAAAERILLANPLLSDRTIALTTGLSAVTIAGIRQRSTNESLRSNVRLGKDGTVRPLNSAEGRRAASALIAGNPRMPLREVAQKAGISLSTACDVRQRMNRGDDPVPLRQRAGEQPVRQRARGPRHGVGAAGRVTILRALCKDPSLRYTDAGRQALAWLCAQVPGIEQGHRFLGELPPHCLGRVAELARGCAEVWWALAEDVEARARLQDGPDQQYQAAV